MIKVAVIGSHGLYANYGGGDQLVNNLAEKNNGNLPLSEGIPDQESWGVTIIMTHDGLMRAEVKSGHLKKYNEQEYIVLDSSVVVDFFDLQERLFSASVSLT